MAVLADSPAPQDRKPIIDSAVPRTTLPLALPAVIVLVLFATARLLEPTYGVIPLLDDSARFYYLFALALLVALIGVDAASGLVEGRQPLVDAAANTLLVGGVALVFVGHQGIVVALVMLVLALVDGWTRLRVREVPGTVLAIRVLTAPLLWIFVFGLLEFHLRWAFSLPAAFIAGTAAFIRLEAGDAENLSILLPRSAIGGLAVAQLVMATSFLDVRSAVGATLVTISIAAIYGVLTMPMKYGTT